ncbi:MAG: PAS domain S-box protein [Candidatus Aenigmatarchaeota archaeon]
MSADNREQDKFHELLNNMPDAIAIIDRKGTLFEANEAAERLTGYRKKELLGKNIFDTQIFDRHTKMLVLEKMSLRLSGKKVSPYEIEIRRKDGKSIPIELNASLIDYAGKKAVLVIIRDVRERKKAEQKLYDSEERFRQISEIVKEFIWEVDAKGLYTYASPNVKAILGYSSEEIVGKKHFFDFFHPDERESLKKSVFSVFAKKEAFRGFINRNLRKDGKVVILETSGLPLIDNKGKLIGYRGADTDITERIKTEEKYKNIIQTSTDGFWVVDNKGRFLEVNDAYCKMIGYTREELLKMSISDIEAVEKPEETEAHIKNIMKTGADRFETKHKRKDGKLIDVEISVRYERETGEMFVFARDITERKQTEKKITESFEKARMMEDIVNRSPVVAFLWKNAEGWPVEFVSENIRVFGYEPEELISGKIPYPKIVHPEDLQRVGEEVSRYSKMKIKGFKQEYRIVTKSGDVRWIDDRTWVRRDPSGKITHYQGIVMDITERKRMEEELQAKIRDLERFNRLAVGRELRMIELKKRIKELEGGK